MVSLCQVSIAHETLDDSAHCTGFEVSWRGPAPRAPVVM
jgi:hypothetical protein